MFPDEIDLNKRFYDAKNERRTVRVVDVYERTFEGRIYRNGTDRVNIVPLNIMNTNGYAELYYAQIVWLEVLDPEPEGLKEFYGDWNKLCIENRGVNDE